MIDRPAGWDQNFTKRMVLIGFNVHPEHRTQVDEFLDGELKAFDHREYDDTLIDDIESAMEYATDQMYNNGWIE